MNDWQVLVVDDDCDFAESPAKVPTKVPELEGHWTTVAFPGEAALAHLTQDDIELAFVDIALPRLDGTDALRAIQSLRSSMRGVMTSGLNADYYAPDARRFGIMEIVQKPFGPTRLSGKLELLVQGPGRQ